MGRGGSGGKRACITFPSLEPEESTEAVSGSPKTTQSQRVPVPVPNTFPLLPPTTRLEWIKPHPPPGGSLSGAAASPSRDLSEENARRQLVPKTSSNNKLVQNSRVKGGN